MLFLFLLLAIFNKQCLSSIVLINTSWDGEFKSTESLMSPMTFVYAAIAMVAFAANSLLCRMALVETDIGPASFTLVRLFSGAVVLSLLVKFNGQHPFKQGSWTGALALFCYAAGFSFAYQDVTTGTGALLLFGAVQITMISIGFVRGERFCGIQTSGFIVAFAGLVYLCLPGVTAPPLLAALLMILAGACWGIYSILGKGVQAPLLMTAGNFVRTVPFAVVLFLLFSESLSLADPGLLYGVLSGAIASGLGYAIWYAVLPNIAATNAATLQLSVPVIATFMGWVFLAETLSMRIGIASLAIIGGIILVIRKSRRVR